MKKIMVLFACLVLAFSSLSLADNNQLIDASRATVKSFAGQLRGELVSAMEFGGPISAISVCNVAAPEITEKVSADKGMHIARTSLKLRNMKNASDDWERKVLESFELRKNAGEDIQNIEFSEVVATASEKEFRYMKAIPTGVSCLQCHGDDMSADIAKKLDELYPQDKARGFKLGDIRGAFTIRQEIK